MNDRSSRSDDATPRARREADAPVATLSLDLDDLWAYLRTHGEDDWDASPTVLPRAVERLLPVLDDIGVTITVFVVGRDLERPGGRDTVRSIAAAGHELGSHSWLHRGDLPTLGADAIAADLERTAAAIAAATGNAPVGFRCPSFGMSPDLVDALIHGGYTYDSSVLPTVLGPLLRTYHRATMRADVRRTQPVLFGPARNALLPLQPFRWTGRAGGLLELPVTTLPLARIPLHMSYLQALAAWSPAVAGAYARLGLGMCRRFGVLTSFLLHPPDVLDVDDVPRLSYFPGMTQGWRAKVALVRRTLESMTDGFDVMTMARAAQRLRGGALTHRSVTGDRAEAPVGGGHSTTATPTS